jgi:hypothetical protein
MKSRDGKSQRREEKRRRKKEEGRKKKEDEKVSEEKTIQVCEKEGKSRNIVFFQ